MDICIKERNKEERREIHLPPLNQNLSRLKIQKTPVLKDSSISGTFAINPRLNAHNYDYR
jgi:hypothetical protein